MTPALGTCYYPEHWPEKIWAEDAARMADAGLTWVRIGEFAWSRIEPNPGEIDTDWLDRAIDVLGGAGLRVVLGTPTATPPRWMLDKQPDMLALDAEGRPRGFGSRRHYCFSHQGYLDECRRIVTLLAERYGANPHVAAWQTDNEYGCHDTTLSYSDAARRGFRDWLGQKYQSIEALNRAWGNVFWSMEYRAFDEVDLPNLTVTEPNPAHVLAFRRFASAEVVRFNRVQAEIIRAHSKAPISHNFMGGVTDFDHFDVGQDLEIATWDSYPLGFLMDRLDAAPEHKLAYARQGDPDYQAFFHDLYRAVGRGRMWVMEQQPGPVNWAPWNPAPQPGMVRLWTWEAFAHGAEVVAYFRWRQAPFAQEQLHAGLLRPDSAEAPGLAEARQVAGEIADLGTLEPARAQVGLVFNYVSAWAWEIQPQGQDFTYLGLVFSAYAALRRAGLSVDIVPPDADLSAYALVFAPGLFQVPDLANLEGIACIGPRANARDADFKIPDPLPPNLPGLDTRVSRLESLPPGLDIPAAGGGHVIRWFEHVEGDAPALLTSEEGPILVGKGPLRYLAGWPDDALWDRIIEALAREAGLTTEHLPEGLRLRDTASHRFVFNYATESRDYCGHTLPPSGVLWLPR